MALGRLTGRRNRAAQRDAANGEAPDLNGQVPDTGMPRRLEVLAATALGLAENIEAADQALTADEAVDARESRLRLEELARSCRAIASELSATAGELNRITAVQVGACDIAWGVCPDHGITLLVLTGQEMTCRVPGCHQGSADRITHRCGEPVKYRVVDAAGAAFLACTGHALACRQQLTGAVITLASDSLEHL